MNTPRHTDDDGSGFVLWIERAATAAIFHDDLAHLIPLHHERRRVLGDKRKMSVRRCLIKISLTRKE